MVCRVGKRRLVTLSQGVRGWQTGAAPFLEWDEEVGTYTLNGVTYANFADWWTAVGGSYTRAGNKRYIDAAGVMQTAGANVWPLEYDPADLSIRGRSVHPAVTARGVGRRDLTNAGWTKTNGTAAKDQTGIDGAANAASSFEATSANATCLQSVSDGTSRNRCLPVYIKRLVGTGSVELTVDGGTTWTAVTSRLVQDEWADCIAAKASVTNPSFGLRLATAGDKVAWDFGRCVDGYYPGPPLDDAENNSADAPTIPLSGLTAYDASGGVLAVRLMDQRDDTLTGSTAASLYKDGNNAIELSRQSNAGIIFEAVVSSSFTGSAGVPAGNIGPASARALRSPNWYAGSWEVDNFVFSAGGYAGGADTTVPALPGATVLRLGYGRGAANSAIIAGVRMYRRPARSRVALVAASCTPKPVAVRGDSVASGATASQGWLEWSALLAKALSPTRSRGDLGVGGSTSAQCLSAMQADTDRREQTHIIWTTHNDSLTAQQSVDNLSAMAALLPHGRILFGTPLVNSAIDAGAATTRKEAIAELIKSTFPNQYIDFQQAFYDNGGSTLFTTGEIHPNDAGQVVAYQAALAVMQARGW